MTHSRSDSSEQVVLTNSQPSGMCIPWDCHERAFFTDELLHPGSRLDTPVLVSLRRGHGVHWNPKRSVRFQHLDEFISSIGTELLPSGEGPERVGPE